LFIIDQKGAKYLRIHIFFEAIEYSNDNDYCPLLSNILSSLKKKNITLKEEKKELLEFQFELHT